MHVLQRMRHTRVGQCLLELRRRFFSPPDQADEQLEGRQLYGSVSAEYQGETPSGRRIGARRVRSAHQGHSAREALRGMACFPFKGKSGTECGLAAGKKPHPHPGPPLEREGEIQSLVRATPSLEQLYARPGFMVLIGADGFASSGEDSAGVTLPSTEGFAVCGETRCLVPPSRACFRFGDSAGPAGLVVSLCSCTGTGGTSRLRS